jgi:hypothetical protein
MKVDFDTFEFAGLIAPGVIVVLASLLLWPQLIMGDNATVVIVLVILASYIVGHLVAAVGNIVEPIFKNFGVLGLESCPYKEWVDKRNNYIAHDQLKRLQQLVHTNLYRDAGLDWEAFKKDDSVERKTVVRQMYLAVVGRPNQRVTTFDGLYSLSRGIAVSLFMCALAALFFARVGPALLCLGGAGLAVYRMGKFKRVYCRELLQLFLMQEDRATRGRRRALLEFRLASSTRRPDRNEDAAEVPLG